MINPRTLSNILALTGEQGDPQQSAARMAHLKALVAQVPREPSCRTVAAAPSMAEHNAMVRDVQALFAGFNALRTLLERSGR